VPHLIIGIEFKDLLIIGDGFILFIPFLVFFRQFKIQIHIIRIIFQFGEQCGEGVDSRGIVLDFLESAIPVFFPSVADETVNFRAIGF